ncbi:MAG TPA: hypothetical protein VGA48_07895 [Thermoplasmata archaeon]
MQLRIAREGQECKNACDQIASPILRIREYVGTFGRLAAELLNYHDLGIGPQTVRSHIANIDAELAHLEGLGDALFTGLPREIFRPEIMQACNSKKNLRYVAGAIMMTERFRDDLTPENRNRAISAKIAYELLLDTLDDLIDRGSYGFADALDLMRYALAPLTARTFEEEIFQDELRGRLAPEDRHLTDFLTAVVSATHRAIRTSPHGVELAGEFERIHENWTLGQACTMYQKEPTIDIRAFVTAASRFPAPAADVRGVERVSGWLSHTAAVTLLDLCFVDHLLSPEKMDEHLAAWFYLDAVPSYLDNIADLSRDIDDGIANLFLIARGGDAILDLRRVRGLRPKLAVADYESFLERTAEFCRRGLVHAAASHDGPDDFYPFIALMFPVVMFSDEHGVREDLLHAYLRCLDPAMRQARAGSAGAAITIPRGTRSGRSQSARTASS